MLDEWEVRMYTIIPSICKAVTRAGLKGIWHIPWHCQPIIRVTDEKHVCLQKIKNNIHELSKLKVGGE